MIKILVLGNVDSGKTTFVKRYVPTKIKEKYGRTESLNFLEGTIQGSPVLFIDSPGHKELNQTKDLAIELADLIVYIIDYRDPQFPYLDVELLKKPIIFLLNKYEPSWGFKKSLKETILEKPISPLLQLYSEFLFKYELYYAEQKILLSQVMDLILDSDFKKPPLIPINLKAGWGLKEVENLLAKYFFKKIKAPELSLLILKRENPSVYELQPTYLHDLEFKNLYLNLDRKYSFNELFEHNLTLKNFILKKQISPSCLKVFDVTKTSTTESSIVATKLNLEHFNDPFSVKEKDLIAKEKYEFLCFYRSINQKKILERLLEKVGLTPVFFKGPFLNFINLKASKKANDLANKPGIKPYKKSLNLYKPVKETETNIIKLGFSKEVISEPWLVLADSYYPLLERLKKLLNEKYLQRLEVEKKKLNTFLIGQIDLKYIFKYKNKKLIAGSFLEHGILINGAPLLLKVGPQLVKAKVLEMEKDHLKLQKIMDTSTFAININIFQQIEFESIKKLYYYNQSFLEDYRVLKADCLAETKIELEKIQSLINKF